MLYESIIHNAFSSEKAHPLWSPQVKILQYICLESFALNCFLLNGTWYVHISLLTYIFFLPE